MALLSCNLQPLDLGIIRAVKAYYRRTLVQRVLINLEDSDSCEVNVKNAKDMIANSECMERNQRIHQRGMLAE